MYTVTSHSFKSTPSGKVYLRAGELIDITINNAKRNKACYICGEISHFARTCPSQHQRVRMILRAIGLRECFAFAEAIQELKEGDFIDDESEEEDDSEEEEEESSENEDDDDDYDEAEDDSAGRVQFRLQEILYHDDKISIFKARHGVL